MRCFSSLSTSISGCRQDAFSASMIGRLRSRISSRWATLLAKNSSTGTGWVVLAPEAVISETLPGSSTMPLVPPTLAYSLRKTDWSGRCSPHRRRCR